VGLCQLGCFLLTEMQAGVLSGLIVETTADWDPELQRFILHTPSDKAAKNWISQVFSEESAVEIYHCDNLKEISLLG
jgi:acyl-CoA oxidase